MIIKRNWSLARLIFAWGAHVLRGRYSTAFVLAATFASGTSAQESGPELVRMTADFTALVDAENGKSTLCKGYVGKTVVPANFDAVAKRLSGVRQKGEYETTSTYEARRAAAVAGAGGPIVLALPTDREYIRYDADTKTMTIAAGAFAAGRLSDEPQPEMALFLATPRSLQGGVVVPHSHSERLLSAHTARNGFGASLRVSEIERHTKALHVTTAKLFSFPPRDSSPIMALTSTVAAAPRIKQTIKVALLAEPTEPYLISGSMDGAAATVSKPTHYTELVSAIVVKPLCGLLLDAQFHVLASADAGTK